MNIGALALAAALVTTSALADSPDVCRPYATHATQIILNYTWLRIYTSCLNADQAPPLPGDPLGVLHAAIPGPTIDPGASPPGSVPATGKPAEGPASKPATVAISSSSPSSVCARWHRRAVWHGKIWRCR